MSRPSSIIDTPSIYSNYEDGDKECWAWPRLVELQENYLVSNPEALRPWQSCPYPEELSYIPTGCSDELARIIHESLVIKPHALQPCAPAHSGVSTSDSQQGKGECLIQMAQSTATNADCDFVPQGPCKSLSVSRWSLGSTGRATEHSSGNFRNPILKLPKAVRELKPQNQIRHTFG